MSKVWFITGCSSGIGESLALRALAKGDRVIATARAPIDRLAALEKAGAKTLELDVTSSPEAIKEVVHKAIAVHGQIDVVVPNAGLTVSAVAEDLTPEIWQRVLGPNFYGVVNVVAATLPHLRERKTGTVAFTNSIYSHSSYQLGAPYAVSKHAVSAYAKTLSLELGMFNIKVISFDIGFIKTPIVPKSDFIPPKSESYQPLMEYVTKIAGGMLGNEPGDPDKLSDAMIHVVNVTEKPYSIVPMAKSALTTIRKYAEVLNQSCDEWEALAKGVDVDEPLKGTFADFNHYLFFAEQ